MTDAFLYSAPPGGTLLSYAIAADPDPLRVSSAATLTLVVSNPGRTVVDCTSIRLAIPRGPQAKDLTGDTSIETRVPDGWAASVDSDAIVFTPSVDAGRIGADGVAFTLADIAINDQPGIATLTIAETASAESRPAQQHDVEIDLSKFPIAFSLSELDCDPDDIASGGSATLSWTGTGDNVTYALSYHPGDGGDPIVMAVDATGPYTAENLTRTGGVVFTLAATMTLAGQDAPIVVKRQVTVLVETLSLSLAVEPATVGVNGLVRLRWHAPNAEYCMLADGTRLPAAGSYFLILTESRDFTMSACLGDQSVQEQRHVTVSNAIVPTEAGYNMVGATGSTGVDGQSYFPIVNRVQIDNMGAANLRGGAAFGEGGNPFGGEDWGDPPFVVPPQFPSLPGSGGASSDHSWTAGSPGGAGGDARLDVQLPPLDTTARPGRVIPITVTGGTGGAGGKGGTTMQGDFPYDTLHQPDGAGGAGGNAILNASFGKPGETPAQYIIVLTAGAGGGGSPAGAAGQTTFTMADEP